VCWAVVPETSVDAGFRGRRNDGQSISENIFTKLLPLLRQLEFRAPEHNKIDEFNAVWIALRGARFVALSFLAAGVGGIGYWRRRRRRPIHKGRLLLLRRLLSQVSSVPRLLPSGVAKPAAIVQR
jgi:hypothetical protein